MKKRIFLTGGTSLLGAGFLSKIPKGVQVVTVSRSSGVNVADKTKLQKAVLNFKPDIFIHGAALGDVDYCEKNHQETWKINVLGTKHALDVCKQIGIPIIYISTNAIFDGKKDIYGEEDKPNPLNFYGKTKYEAEKMIQKYSNPWTIIRPITMYGWQPKAARLNPVTWILEKLSKNENIKIVDDVYLNPLYNKDLAKVLWKTVEKNLTGIYHVAGSEVVNRYNWAIYTAEIFGFNKQLITPVKSSYFAGKIANRPSQTIYSIEKIKKKLGIIPKTVKEGLMEMKNEKISLLPKHG